MVIRSPKIPASTHPSADERPSGSHLGEALGEDPIDPYPMGNEAFIQDHLRDVTQAVANDLRKIAVLPDKLEGETAGRSFPKLCHPGWLTHPVEQT